MRDLTYPGVVLAARAAMKALGIQLQLRGTEHVPRSGGAVLACSHVSYLDFIFAGWAAQPSGRLVRFMAKQEVFNHRLSGPAMRSLHHIPVDRGRGLESYATALDYLRAGEIVGIFPEATISRSFELKTFKSGAVRMAAAVGVPLIPVVVWGTQRMYTKDHPRDFSRGQTLALTVGEPMTIQTGNPLGETARVKVTMARLRDETIRAYPEMPQGAWWLPVSYGGSAPTLEEAARLDVQERRDRLGVLTARAQRRADRRWRLWPPFRKAT
ncbi:MAG: 1-acyl-sn-glycerol-3-phosphate acyltransferase [Actinomycetota bacterium]|nr:1-acyl-sn-glycerol-3-phosphate acyltransferase [Actinomycetota bacterium]